MVSDDIPAELLNQIYNEDMNEVDAMKYQEQQYMPDQPMPADQPMHPPPVTEQMVIDPDEDQPMARDISPDKDMRPADEDADLQMALAASMQGDFKPGDTMTDPEMWKAIARSYQDK